MATERHEGEVIRLALLAGDEGTVADREFVDCDVRGPAIVVLGEGVRMESNTFDGDADALFWELDPGTRPRVIGAVGLKNCSFLGCSFRNVGIAGPKTVIDMFRNQ